MRRALRIAGIVAGILLVCAGAAAAFAYFGSEHKRNRVIAVAPSAIAIPDDPAAMERGKYLFETRGCTDCHGRDGAGHTFIEDSGGLVVRGPNITMGQGSPVLGYRAVDWVKAIRHGVTPNGRPLIVMPSEDYNRMTDADLGAMVAYIRSLPAREGDGRRVELPLPVQLAYALGVVRDAAEKIDHSLPPAQPPAPDDVLGKGAYAANMCLGCHGEGFRGGPIAGAPPDWPPAADLRPGGPMRSYASAEDFAGMLRTGRRPDGSDIKVMPFDSLKELSDDEIAALFAFLQSLPPAD